MATPLRNISAARSEAGLPGIPASPDELEAGREYRKRRQRGAMLSAREVRLAGRSVAWAAAGVLGGLLVVAAVRWVHDLWVAPRVQQFVEQEVHKGREAAEQLRRGVLLERHSGSSDGLWPLDPATLEGAAAGGDPDAANADAAAAPCPSHCGCNCSGVGLAQADHQLLRREVSGILRALSDTHPWVLGLPEVQAEGAEAALPGQLAKGQALQVAGAQVQRVVDEPYGPRSTSSVPGVEDVHAELRAYGQALVEAMVLDGASAAARQRRTTAAELLLAPADELRELSSLRERIAFLNELREEVQAGETVRVCVTATTSADVRGVRRDLLPWMQYHTALGAAHFYLLYDGDDGEAVALLDQLRHVTLMHTRPSFASAEELEGHRLWAAALNATASRQWAGQPGNYDLMVKQGYGETRALQLAARDGMHWLLHIDPDELFHPGGPVFSLPAVLGRQPAHTPCVRFMNFEGQPEAGDIVNRLEQVTLFRVHKHFITPEALFYRSLYKLGDSAAFLTLYANGKPAVRVDAPGVRQLGPHFFTGNPSPRWQTADNPLGEWQDAVSDDSVVLHYAYSTAADVADKARRSCPDSHLEAARSGDRAKVKECFVIDFDADAYMAVARGPAAAQDFFFERMVLSEGARVRCTDPVLQQQASAPRAGWCSLTDIERFKYLMEKVGLYRRLHGPATLLRQQEHAIQGRLRLTGGGKG